MRKLWLILFICILTQSVKAQVVFCPTGAVWKALYAIGNWTDATENSSIAYVRDSIIGSETVKVLKHKKFFYDCNDQNEFLTLIKQHGDTVFMFNKYTENKWTILFNYACQPGSGWTTTFSNYLSFGVTYTITVGAVKTITENNFNLRELIVTIQYKDPNMIKTFYNVSIRERYGWGFLFFYTNGQGCHGDYFIKSLCYQDIVFGIKQFSNDACDYSNPLGIKNIAPTNEQFKIFPNPFHDIVNIDTYLLCENEIRVTDVSGKEILRTKETQINTAQLSKGIYFLEVYENGFLLKTQKLIKE